MSESAEYRKWADKFLEYASSPRSATLGDLVAHDAILRDVLLLGDKPITFTGLEAVKAHFEHEDTRKAFEARLKGAAAKSIKAEDEQGGTRLWVGFESDVVGGTLSVFFPPGQKDNRASRITMILDEWKAWKVPGATRVGERDSQQALQDAEVLIVGAGQAGLQTAHRLQSMGFNVAVVEQTERVGDVWRHKYKGLRLHLPKRYMTFLDYPYPDDAPTFLPGNLMGDHMERYVEEKNIAVYTSTRVVPGIKHSNGRWDVELSENHGTTTVQPKYLVWSTGVCGKPKIPTFPTTKQGMTILHTHHLKDPADFKDKRVLVVGTGNSGMDCAKVLYQAGAKPTILQRSPSAVISIEFNTQGLYQVYPSEDYDSVRDCDLRIFSMPWSDVRAFQEGVVIPMQYDQVDRDMLEGLRAKGFKSQPGSGLLNYFEKFGGYYLNTGCAERITAGDIAVLSGTIERIEGDQVILTGGEKVAVDVLMLATGYHSINQTIEDTIPFARGKLEPYGGTDTSGELRVGYTQTSIPRFYIAAADFSAARHCSKYLGLTLQGIKLGLISETETAR